MHIGIALINGRFLQGTLLYSYNHVMHGFSSRITPSQLSELHQLPGHHVAYRESYGKLFTTRTPKFLGLKHISVLWSAASYVKDVIIRLLDTGIWAGCSSFNDKAMTPVAERWKAHPAYAKGTLRGVTPGALFGLDVGTP
ncbi:hypothetical protein IFM89_015224 [Coptis chinensis]|uniref:Inhibitor I9 domain-containing protein n=1 Tax=Coptis chinensis TaxID=261450 RepID=A0A835H5E0_9MAGN|nr:hypothetical protein IFM89_015224 [Coptis chinensis]